MPACLGLRRSARILLAALSASALAADARACVAWRSASAALASAREASTSGAASTPAPPPPPPTGVSLSLMNGVCGVSGTPPPAWPGATASCVACPPRLSPLPSSPPVFTGGRRGTAGSASACPVSVVATRGRGWAGIERGAPTAGAPGAAPGTPGTPVTATPTAMRAWEGGPEVGSQGVGGSKAQAGSGGKARASALPPHAPVCPGSRLRLAGWTHEACHARAAAAAAAAGAGVRAAAWHTQPPLGQPRAGPPAGDSSCAAEPQTLQPAARRQAGRGVAAAATARRQRGGGTAGPAGPCACPAPSPCVNEELHQNATRFWRGAAAVPRWMSSPRLAPLSKTLCVPRRAPV